MLASPFSGLTPSYITSICSLVNRLRPVRTPIWTVTCFSWDSACETWTDALPCGVCICCKALKTHSCPLSVWVPSKKKTGRWTWLMRWWKYQEAGGISQVECTTLMVCFCLPSVTVHAHRWRSAHFDNRQPFSGLSITKCHRLHGGGDEHTNLSLSQAGAEKKKSRFSMYVCCSQES